MEDKIQPIIEVKDFVREKVSRRDDGRRQARKLITSDKIYDIPATGIPSNAITQAMMTDNSVGQSEFKDESVTLAFGSADTVKTATVTSGSIIVGSYASSVTGNPASASLQLGVSGTTLTGTRSAAPGGATAVTYTVNLLKI